jgi:hypothetical protein
VSVTPAPHFRQLVAGDPDRQPTTPRGTGPLGDDEPVVVQASWGGRSSGLREPRSCRGRASHQQGGAEKSHASGMNWSKASLLADEGLKIVDNVMSYAKTGVGQPGRKEQSLFLSSTAMAYAVWENYVEQVAIELIEFIVANIASAAVPERPKQEISKKDAWDIAVHPGWQAIWIELVRNRAVGSESGTTDFGLNTANSVQVKKLFDLVGVVAFDGLSPDMMTRLDQLVGDRGTIVHTAQAPSKTFRKADAVGWRDFVKELYEAFDQSLSRQTQALVGRAPW